MVLITGVQALLDVTVTEMVLEWVSGPPDPVIVTVYVPGMVWQVVMIVRVEDADPPLETERVVGFRLMLVPGAVEVERVTAVFHQFWAVTVTEGVAEDPCATLAKLGTESAKSAIFIVMTAVWWLRVPLEAVTVQVYVPAEAA